MLNQNDELKKAGLKATLPRIKIMQVLASTSYQDVHFSAEDIYKELLKMEEDIGLATVYRVLTQFESAGIVKKHHFEDSRAVYEIISDEHHDHMVCVDTGDVLEFNDEIIENQQKEIARKAGYEIVDHSMILYVKKKISIQKSGNLILKEMFKLLRKIL